MKKVLAGLTITLVCAALVVGAIAVWQRHATAATDQAAAGETKPVASVTVAPLATGLVSIKATAFGTVIARAEQTQMVSVPFESQAVQINVSVGQHLAAGATFLQIRPSVAARTTLDDARNAVAAAERDLALIKQRYDQKLTTNSELYTAQNTLRSAQNRLTGVAQLDSTKPLELKSEIDCVITKIDVQPGQTTAAGTPLIETIPTQSIQARLAVDASIVNDLKAGQLVELTMNGTPAIAGKLATLTNRIDPATRLTDVYVEFPPGVYSLDMPVVAKFTIAKAGGFVVPHDAIVPNEEGNYELFTVKGEKAVIHTVQLIAQDDEQAQISGEGLAAGDLVVSSGNYVLEDGIAVKAERAAVVPTQPASATTRPDSGDAK